MRTLITILVAALAGLPAVALAHAKLIHSTPANGSALTAAPSILQLKFDEPARLTSLGLLKTGDKVTTRIGLLEKKASSEHSIALPKLTPGSYTITYRVVGDDNHLMSGSLNFTVSSATSVAAAPATDWTAGEVRTIDRQAGTVTLRHGAIRNLGMPAMTMVFSLKNRALLESLSEGSKVNFKAMREGGKLVITELNIVK